MLMAMALFISMPRNVRTGIRTIPPPIPARAPMKPAATEIEKRSGNEITYLFYSLFMSAIIDDEYVSML
jgi:hypothetical protein